MLSLEEACFTRAAALISSGLLRVTDEVDLFDLTDLLISLEKEKEEKNNKSDMFLDYNDEIVTIENRGDVETIDISVSGDNLFFCQDILTKNSFGVPATADFMLALVTSDELEALHQLMAKQLKNRFRDVNVDKKFVIGVDKPKMRMYDVEQPTADLIDDKPVMDNTGFGEQLRSRSRLGKHEITDFDKFM